MNKPAMLCVLAAALLAVVPVHAAGNEAVTTENGVRKVKLREYAQAYKYLHNRWRPHDYALTPAVRNDMTSMMETSSGLQECLMPFYDAKFCQPSTLGTVRKPRRWVVLREGTWYTCKRADSPRKDCAGPNDTYSVYEVQ